MDRSHKARLTPYYAAVCFLTAAMLAGCGGGSSGTASTATAVSISQQNSTQAAGAVYQAAQGAQASGSTGSSTFTAVVLSNGARAPSLTRFAQDQITRLAGVDYSAAANVAVSATTSISLPCDTPSGGTAGSISISINDADNSGTLTSGDTLSATFQSCYTAADGQTVNGGFSLSGFTLSGNPQLTGTAWNASATFAFTNLSITDTTGTEAVDGGFTFTSQTTDGITTTVTLSGSSLSLQQSAGLTLTLQNFNISGTEDSNTLVNTVYGTGRVIDSSLGGYVDFNISATSPLQGTGGLDPSSGTMTITGANNSSLTLTVISSTSVQLQVDANGDGTAEYTVTKTWADLSP